MKNPNAILRALLAFMLFGCAQAAPERTCRIVFLERPGDAPKVLQLFDGKKSQQVELPSMNLSPIYKFAHGAVHLKLLADKAENPEAVSPEAPMVEIPADYTDIILIVSSDPENPIAPVSIKAINLAREDFKPGQILWINNSDKTIKGELGERTLSLAPQDSAILDAPLTEAGVPASGHYHARFTYQKEENGDFVPITEQQWWHDANSRHLGFIANTGGKLPKIHFYRDFRDPAGSGSGGR